MIKKENEEIRIISNTDILEEKEQEIENLIHDNTILNEECMRLREE